jgi:hypothetical protein
MGLLIAGLSVPAAIMKLLPKWLVVFGFALGIIGELSALNLIIPQALFLIPLTRFRDSSGLSRPDLPRRHRLDRCRELMNGVPDAYLDDRYDVYCHSRGVERQTG